MPVLSWPLYAGLRVRIVAGSVKNGVSGRGPGGGRWGPMAYSATLLAGSNGGALKPAARLKLTLLGGFQAQLDAGAALVLPTRKAQALLAYLAVPPGLVLDGPSVALDPAVVDVDVARFERLAADGRPAALEQIAGLYRGDLLAGLALAERPFE